MPHEKWFISDTHFLHNNMLKFVDDQGHKIRPFNSCKEMDETMVKNWNSVVGHNDYVYHLGDVTFQYNKLFQEIMYSLKGDKRLIIGNHDKMKQEGLTKHFSKIMLWHGFREHNFTAVHLPIRLDTLRDGKFCVHGHIHQRHMEDPHYINMSVKVRNYTPVHIDQIIKEIEFIERDTNISK
jgi:calcineurin-like phosphoesterase family protein